MVDAAEMPSELGPADYLMHRREAHSHARLGSMGVVFLDAVPDWNRFRAHFEGASRRVPRLRQKVVVPTLPTTAPRWVVDPDFDVNFHVRRMRVPEPGTPREVFDLADELLRSPMDTSRPLWIATLVEGLADGTSALLFRIGHALTDGIGALEMFAQVPTLERDPPGESPPPAPIPQNLSPDDLMWEGIRRQPRALVEGVRRALWGALRAVGRLMRNPVSALVGGVGYARSAVRVMSRPVEPSPLLRQRGSVRRSEALDIGLSALHSAAKAGGGSLNDAYLAALCGALGRYHRALGAPIDALPMAVPVNVRGEADLTAANQVSSVMLAAPVGEDDPVTRMGKIRAQMTQRRNEPARDVSHSIARLVSVLPAALLTAMSSGGFVDVVASNVPSYRGDIYLAGAKVLRQHGLASVPGVGMVVVLLSAGDRCTVTVNYDRAAIREQELFARCLREGFDEILKLAGEPVPRAFAVDGEQ
ncbi:wax ester/triacylglycerol synthase family O-acyltransferase [Mycobacterium celatum]|uniref:Diacylglycerol O-acyltransferase n=1 Tax=Mycobacterium celatum TaxID=28045 RepID=A0A1X1RRE2_MYCCE|nr:wax ester/triacylglycerol synthase family O-acyltransferase [Mycobacterium celatum]ORV13922.1 diacylglycerol O-acyltransferase [Mycobacterium celatum]PIB80193.1 wax ester/triacylglycerol synthase family O-acyltransferase [Mycobacterium celatum]